MKHFALSFITVVLLHVSLHAQQWEFDYGDAQSWTWYINGIVDSEGNTVMVGGYASEFPNYHPIVMRVGPDGTHNRHEYEGLEGLLLKDVVQLPNGNYFAVGDFSGEAFGVMILDANLEMVAAKRYEREGASLYYYFGARLLLDDDGTVVMSGRPVPRDLVEGMNPAHAFIGLTRTPIHCAAAMSWPNFLIQNTFFPSTDAIRF